MTLTTDPVCGVEIEDETTAFKSTHEGDTYFFCDEGCRTKFDDDPRRFGAPDPAA